MVIFLFILRKGFRFFIKFEAVFIHFRKLIGSFNVEYE